MNTTLPKVSVVMPVYNAERDLRQAIDSVLGQSLAALELILVDDGSSDGSWQIAQALAATDPRLRIFRNERNLGIVPTRNRAFALAHPESRYFAIMDADDVCRRNRLEHQVAFLDSHPDHALVGGHTRIIDAAGAHVGERRYPTSHEAICRVITRYNPIAQPTATLRRTALAAVGHYDERYPRCQDYDLWLRLAARFRIANLDEVTLDYRVSATQGKRTHLRETLRMTIAIQRKWLFDPRFYHPQNVAYWAAEHALLALPEAATLALFKRITYAG